MFSIRDWSAIMHKFQLPISHKNFRKRLWFGNHVIGGPLVFDIGRPPVLKGVDVNVIRILEQGLLSGDKDLTIKYLKLIGLKSKSLFTVKEIISACAFSAY